MDGFDNDGVGAASGGQDGEECGASFAVGADDGDVTGVGIGGEEQVFVGREGEGIGCGAGVDAGD